MVDAAPPRGWAGLEPPQACEQLSDKYSWSDSESETFLPAIHLLKNFPPH